MYLLFSIFEPSVAAARLTFAFVFEASLGLCPVRTIPHFTSHVLKIATSASSSKNRSAGSNRSRGGEPSSTKSRGSVGHSNSGGSKRSRNKGSGGTGNINSNRGGGTAYRVRGGSGGNGHNSGRKHSHYSHGGGSSGLGHGGANINSGRSFEQRGQHHSGSSAQSSSSSASSGMAASSHSSSLGKAVSSSHGGVGTPPPVVSLKVHRQPPRPQCNDGTRLPRRPFMQVRLTVFARIDVRKSTISRYESDTNAFLKRSLFCLEAILV